MAGLKTTLLGSLLLVALALATDAGAALSTSQRACVASQTKSLLRISDAENRALSSCLRDYAAGAPSAPTIQACVTSRRDQVTRAVNNASMGVGAACQGPALPPILVSDVPTLASVAATHRRQIHVALFGIYQPIRRADRPGAAACQAVATRRLVKCARARIAAFDECERKAIRSGGGVPEVSQCVGADPRGRIAKACGKVGGPDPLYDELQRCGWDIEDAFPVCGTGAGSFPTARCLLARVACSSCQGLNLAGDLQANCDQADDQQDNLSCGCGDTIVTPAEQCDDGNLVSGDGCSSTCRIEADADHDGIDDVVDNCPSVANPAQADLEDDGVGDACDNCPTVENADQDPSACECRCFGTEDIDAHVGAGVTACQQYLDTSNDIPRYVTSLVLTDGSTFSSGWYEFPGVPDLTYGRCAGAGETWQAFSGFGNGTIGQACAAEIMASQAWLTHGCPTN